MVTEGNTVNNFETQIDWIFSPVKGKVDYYSVKIAYQNESDFFLQSYKVSLLVCCSTVLLQ